MKNVFLQPAKILDFKSEQIQQLILDRGWRRLDEYQKIGAAYQFVKDEILFG